MSSSAAIADSSENMCNIALGRLHHTLEAETPIGRSLLNKFFNKLMCSERKQEITKVKLKRLDNN